MSEHIWLATGEATEALHRYFEGGGSRIFAPLISGPDAPHFIPPNRVKVSGDINEVVVDEGAL